MEENKSKKIFIIIIAICVVFFIGIIGVCIWYTNGLGAVAKSGKGNEINVEIEEGMGISSISNLLEKNNVIKSATVMKIYARLNGVGNLQAGNYKFDNSEDLVTIIKHIANGEVYFNEMKITFIEGKNMRSIAETIAKNTNNTKQDVFNLLKDEDYINSLIDKYWFLTDEIKNNDIYYPLEGYLLPDTYSLESKDVSVEAIFSVMLNYMDKFLTEYKDKLSDDLSIHEIVSLASMAELEGKSTEDRKEIVGVFMNRIDKNMNLGSDVTTYYAFKVDMGDRDLTVKELNTENPYNTRGPNMAGKIPVGPICNPSKSAIQATLDYTETNALYFVADKNGKVYFTRNNEEHNKMIRTLKSQGLWYVYD